MKDSKCKAYLHTYKCNQTNCDDCQYRQVNPINMEKEVTNIILKTLLNYYGEEKVTEEDGNIYVVNGNGACEISIRYEE